jgi:hypothetical protein
MSLLLFGMSLLSFCYVATVCLVRLLQDLLLTAELQNGDNFAAAINMLTSTTGSGQRSSKRRRTNSRHRRSLLLADTMSHFFPRLHPGADLASVLRTDSMPMLTDNSSAAWRSLDGSSGYTGGHIGGHTSWVRSLLQSEPATSGCALPGGDLTVAVNWAPNRTVCI